MLFEFTRDFVFYKQIESRELVDSYLMKNIDENRGKEDNPWSLCNVQSSYSKPPEFNSFLKDSLVLDNILWNPLDHMLSDISSFSNIPLHSINSDAWYNVYKPGFFQEIHDHKSASKSYDDKTYYPAYSAIYILKDGGVPNSTVFTKKVDIMGPIPKSRQNMNTGYYDDIKAGTVIIFPSSLDHFVTPYNGTGERISISFNIYSYYG